MGLRRSTSCHAQQHPGPAKMIGAGTWPQMDGISAAANASTTS